MARPPKPINSKQVEELAERHWSIEQIAAFFRVDRRTIERRFAAVIEDARHRGRAKLIDMLWKRADESDRILENLADRVIGPVQKQMKIDLDKLSDEELARLVEERMKSHASNESDE
jgi:hypothetical protein